jgi:LacI family transcriptional regulator
MTDSSSRLAQSKSPGPAGIKEIAEALGVSIGTVDRALHGRAGINPLTRQKVLKMAQTMGYRPNVAARVLRSKKHLRISAHLPVHVASFFDALRSGIREAAGPFEPTVQLEFVSYPKLGEGDLELLEEAIDESVTGLIIVPADPAAVRPLIRKAARGNIPVVCVASDAPGTERLTCVSACSSTSGAMAGELLSRVRPGAALAVVTGSLATEDHAHKVEGFQSAVAEFDPSAKIVDVIEAHDDAGAAFTKTTELLDRREDVGGIYVSTANSLPVVRAIEAAGRGGSISVVTTDLYPELLGFIRSGRVFATINQRPMTQGRRAFEALYQFLIAGKCPPARMKVAPMIVMKSNLELVRHAVAAAARSGG